MRLVLEREVYTDYYQRLYYSNGNNMGASVVKPNPDQDIWLVLSISWPKNPFLYKETEFNYYNPKGSIFEKEIVCYSREEVDEVLRTLEGVNMIYLRPPYQPCKYNDVEYLLEEGWTR